MKRAFVLSIVVIGLFAGTAEAAPIDVRIDLSGLVSSTGGNWNNLSNLTGLTSGLVDFSTGLATGDPFRAARPATRPRGPRSDLHPDQRLTAWKPTSPSRTTW